MAPGGVDTARCLHTPEATTGCCHGVAAQHSERQYRPCGMPGAIYLEGHGPLRGPCDVLQLRGSGGPDHAIVASRFVQRVHICRHELGTGKC